MAETVQDRIQNGADWEQAGKSAALTTASMFIIRIAFPAPDCPVSERPGVILGRS
jgi:hypothetical protein